MGEAIPLITKIFRNLAYSIIFICAFCIRSYAADEDFKSWLDTFKEEAISKGITQKTLDSALSDVQVLPQVIKLDRSQPEFIQTFTKYYQIRVNEQQIAKAQSLLNDNLEMFIKLEDNYGIPKSILLGFWSLETNFGSAKGDIPTISALVTLAYDGRRRDFFRQQLFETLELIQDSGIPLNELKGSWAGAVGQMQFMPTTLKSYGIDADGDGMIDVWRSIPDAMNSAANYLKSIGWHKDEAVVIQVQLPDNFDWEMAQLSVRKPVSEWFDLGVRPIEGRAFPDPSKKASVILPQGWRGPAFMIFDNFDVIMRWNHSLNYALSIALFADRLDGNKSLNLIYNEDSQALTFSQMMTLQQNLINNGFYSGDPDGIPGNKTQMAIREYQKAHNLPADGYPSPGLLKIMDSEVDGQNAQSSVTQ